MRAFGGLATQVRGLELVTPDGEVLACDATRRPEVFSAARIGLGALGVVTAVTLQAVPAFALRAVEGPGDAHGGAGGLRRADDLDRPRRVLLVPAHRRDAAEVQHPRAAGGGARPLPRWRAVWDDEILANAAFAGVVAAGRRVPGAGPAAGPDVGQGARPRTWTDHAHRVFVSRRRVRFLEMEYAVPRADAVAVLAELRRVHEANDWRAAFPVEVRMAAADDIPLSTASGRTPSTSPRTCPRERTRGPGSRRWRRSRARSAAGRTGESCTAWTSAALQTRYPRFDEFVALRDRLDPTGVLANAYLDRVLGLAPGR